jgi:hypothetical protein
MPMYIYFFPSIKGDEEEREKKDYMVIHFNIQGCSFSRCLSFIVREQYLLKVKSKT